MEVMGVNQQQDLMEKIIRRFLAENKELLLMKLIGDPGLILTAGKDYDIDLEALGAGKVNVTVGSSGKVVFKRSA